MEFITGLAGWEITLLDGVVIRVWASAYSVEDGNHVFSALLRVPVDDQDRVEVRAHTPTDPERVDVALISIPSDRVVNVLSV
jgi:hypothetical protein